MSNIDYTYEIYKQLAKLAVNIEDPESIKKYLPPILYQTTQLTSKHQEEIERINKEIEKMQLPWHKSHPVTTSIVGAVVAGVVIHAIIVNVSLFLT